MTIFKSLLPFTLLLSTYSYAESHTAPVTGIAQSFLTTAPIADATITVLETGTQVKTNEQGAFGPIQYPVGKPITLVFSKPGFVTTQSDTAIVPEQGLTDSYN